MKAIRSEIREDGIAILTFDLEGEKVNKLSTSVGQELERILKDLEKNPKLKGLILISGKPNIFIAGADIREIESVHTKEEGRLKSIEAQKLPNLLEALA